MGVFLTQRTQAPSNDGSIILEGLAILLIQLVGGKKREREEESLPLNCLPS